MVTFDSTDLDNAVSESGVVHESVANTDHNDENNLKQGYQIATPFKPSSVVAYWPFHEDSGTTAYDFSGNNNDGTISGDVTLDVDGPLGTTAYDFGGTDSHVDIPSGIISDGEDYTISFWINHDGGVDYRILDFRGDLAFMIMIDRDGLDEDNFDIYDGTWNENVVSIAENTWKFVHMVHDESNTNLDIYINGSLEASINNNPGSDTASSRIGDFYGGTSQTYSGKLASFRFDNVAFTSSKVQTHYDVVNAKGTLKTGYKGV